MDSFLLFVLIVVLALAVFVHIDEMEGEVERLEAEIDRNEKLIEVQYKYINDLQHENERIYNKFAEAINFNKTNMVKKSDLSLMIEGLVGQYLEVPDER